MNHDSKSSSPEGDRPSRDEILERLRLRKAEFEARFGVRTLALFGSYATGEDTERSDVDILVDVDPAIGLGFVTLAEIIEAELGIPVDLVSVRAIKPRYRDAVEHYLVYV